MDLPSQVAQANQEAEDLIVKMQAPKEAPKEEPKQASDDPNSETWKQRYEVISGKYNAEIVPFKENVDIINKLKHELRTTQSALRAAQQDSAENARLISELRVELDKKKTETPVEIPTSWEQVLTDDEKSHLEMQDLDGDTMKILTKIMANVASSRSPDYEDKFKEIDQRVKAVDDRVYTTIQHTFEEKLRAIPDYEKYFGDTADPEFATWLDKKITPEADITNRDILQQALDRQELGKVMKGIDRFKTEVAPPKKPERQRNPLESRIEPSERYYGNESPTPKGDKQVYTQAEVDKFYIDQTKGLWRGREKEAAILNNKYLTAAKEGRIRF